MLRHLPTKAKRKRKWNVEHFSGNLSEKDAL